ncbi:type 1 glycerol-3-phosphate oxidase [Loigolactobacillus jiayinensis]|uniref:Alpha-glycerophosphate oxidase n=1 Tax=Loigolactobacillus jiayinensis TaxID=2486016 RepID=A0ABW1RHV0_9LACO|nr:type 1 glycerol-3-phosphate oxidase [Loigolactobacillus jiayinensis]
MAFSAATRQENIARLKAEHLDLLIIGGGITGAGVALQASAMGIKTGLIEMQDFSEGTSSRSTKLVHGGIRYLKTFDVEVVADTVKERAAIQHIAPHIPRPDPMLIPIYDEPGATFTMFSLKVAMDLYDRLADVTDPKYTNYTLSRDEVLQREPQLKAENLVGGGVYLDYISNDARLVIENIKQAQVDGGIMTSHVQATQLLHDEQGNLIGAQVKDLMTDEEFTVHARLVINTAGPWSDFVRQLDPDAKITPQMRPTKGVHLVVAADRLPVPQPTYFDTGDQDDRMVFVVPRANKTYFGTTDTDYTADFKHPVATREDVDYLLAIINNRYPDVHLTIDDIEASWAGLRPLIAANSSSDYNGGDSGKLSDQSFAAVIDVVNNYENKQATRSDVEQVLKNVDSALSEHKSNPSAVSRGSDLSVADDGLITLAGGKITDYRKMAAGAITLISHLLASRFDAHFDPIDSKDLAVSGGALDSTNVDAALATLAQQGQAKGLPAADALQLANLYGANVTHVFALIDELSAAPGLTLAETLGLRYALTEEMTLTPVDYLLRRTNHILFQRETLDTVKVGVVNEMARYLGWQPAEKQQRLDQLNQAIAESDLSLLKNNN